MNADRLLQHYEQIAGAPDAIARLRRFILDLAVRGKLVPQNIGDGPASALMTQVDNLSADDTGLPQGWCRAKVGSILNFQYGKGLKATERLKSGPVPVFGSNGVVGYTDEPLTTRPSVIVGRKGSAGALNLCDGPSWTTDVAYFIEVPEVFDIRYLFCSLASLGLDKLGKGVKPGLSRADAYEQTIDIPSLNEQHRICAKVDELMALCDELETARAEREAKRDRLATASLARLNAPDLETFHDDARFVLDALPALTARPDQIKQLRQTILNLAVRGKLVPQDPADEPAEELLKQILEVRNGITRSSKKISIEDAIVQSDNSLSGWVSATVQDVAEVGTGSTPTSTDSSYYSNGHIPWLTSSASGLDEIIIADNFVTEKAVREFRLKIYPPGSLLVALYGQGKTRGQVAKLSLSATVNQACAVITWIAGFEDLEKFMLLIFRQQYHEMRLKAEGGAQPNLNLRKIKELKIPLPPLAEQHRIVAKVDELMALCDQLEASLTSADATRKKLLDALLSEALAPIETSKIQEAAE